ncbi:MAG: hypothetical protein ACE5K4_07575 [Candidatus Hydrothermarchaeota archaeon]
MRCGKIILLIVIALFIFSDVHAQSEKWNEFASKAINVECPCNGIACDFNVIDCKCNIAREVRDRAIILLSQGYSINEVFVKLGLPVEKISNATEMIVESQPKPPYETKNAVPHGRRNSISYKFILGILGALTAIILSKIILSKRASYRNETKNVEEKEG